MGFWNKLFGRPSEDEAGHDQSTTHAPQQPEAAPQPVPQPEPVQPPAPVEPIEPVEPVAEGSTLSDRIRNTPARPMPGFTTPPTPVNETRRRPEFRLPDSAAEVASVNPDTYQFTPVEVSEPAPKAEPAAQVADLLPEPVEVPTIDDERDLDDVLSVLATAGIHPRRPISMDDITGCCPNGLAGFRARPLTSTMELVDADGDFLMHNVSLDRDDDSRTTPDQLAEYATDLAEGAGTGAQVKVRVVPDPGSRLKGSLRVTNGYDVSDIVYNLDPDFGDPAAEEALTSAVAGSGRRAYPILTDTEGERLTAWVLPTTPESFFLALSEENPHTCL